MRAVLAVMLGASLSGCIVAPVGVAPASVAAPVRIGGVPAGMQYLYGSGEAAAISQQAWTAPTGYTASQVRARPAASVVLDEGATLSAPRYVPCGAKPLAAVFDVDETVLLNRGFEYDAATGEPYSDARWRAYEITGGTTTIAVPGAREALTALRRMGVTVIFNSNRAADNAAATTAAIERAGLGPAVHLQTLFLKGDDTTGSLKDARRRRIAARYCVIAMGGDQLGDFSDLLNDPATPSARRATTMAAPLAAKWGAGWFVLPNPVYGTALKGGLDDIFPNDARWAPEP